MIRHNKKSFTLVETIAATLLLSLSVVVIVGISVRSLRMAQLIAVSEQAWDLVDRQLSMIDYIGVQKYAMSGPTEGIYKGDGAEFDWAVEISETTLDSLYNVTVTVGWAEQQGYKKIETQTRMSGY